MWGRQHDQRRHGEQLVDTAESDESILLPTLANKDAAEAPAESTEERDSANGNAMPPASPRTPSRVKRESRGLYGVREAARNSRSLRFTALLHHIDERLLFESFDHLKKSAAAGIDGITWHDYEENVEANIMDLHSRIHRGAYRAKPSRRVWIPKADGRKRPLAIASLEDKIVQQAVLWVIQSMIWIRSLTRLINHG